MASGASPLDAFKAALVAANDATDAPKQAAAQKWLGVFSRSKEAWTVADTVLGTVGFSPAEEPLAFNSALILHQKIKFTYVDLAPHLRLPFRDRLVQHLARFKPDPPAGKKTYATYTRLCLVMATLAIQMEEWKNAVDTFVQMMKGGLLDLAALLKVLTVLPEEAVAGTINVPVKQRRDFQAELETGFQAVLDMLAAQLPSAAGNQTVAQGLFKCLASWVMYCRIPASALVKSPLVGATFAAMKHPALLDDAAEVLINMVHEYYNIDAHADMIKALVPQTMALEPLFTKALAEEDEDTARVLTRVFSEMGETYLRLVLGPHEVGQQAIVMLMLKCTGHPDGEISAITFRFWIELSLMFEHMSLGELRDRRRAMLHPVLEQLIPVLIQAAQFPPDFGDLEKDRQLHFRHWFRFKVAKVMKKVAIVMGIDVVLNRIAVVLKAAHEAFARAAAAAAAAGTAPPEGSWRPLESCLFCLRGIAKHVPHDESTVLPPVMALLETLPPHVELRATSMRLIGRYADWIAQRPVLPQKCFEFLVAHGLEKYQDIVSQAAADAFSYLCDYAGEQLGTLPLDSVSRYNLGALPPEQVLVVMESIAYSLTHQPFDILTTRFSMLYKMLLDGMDKVVAAAAAAGAAGPAGAAVDVKHFLDRMGALVRFTKVPVGRQHPIVPALTATWPSFDRVTAVFHASPTVVEAGVQFHRTWLVRADESSAALLRPLVNMIMTSVRRVLHSSPMFLLTVAIEVWGVLPQHQAALLGAMSEISTMTMTMLSGAPGAFSDNPELVEDFFGMLLEALRVCTSAFLSSPLLDPYVQCACAGMHLEHQRANIAIMAFLEELVAMVGGENSAQVQPIVDKYRPIWVKRVTDLIVVGVPMHVINSEKGSFTGLLFRLAMLDMRSLSDHLAANMASVPAAVFRPDEKKEFMENVCAALERKNINAFADQLLFFANRCWILAKGEEG